MVVPRRLRADQPPGASSSVRLERRGVAEWVALTGRPSPATGHLSPGAPTPGGGQRSSRRADLSHGPPLRPEPKPPGGGRGRLDGQTSATCHLSSVARSAGGGQWSCRGADLSHVPPLVRGLDRRGVASGRLYGADLSHLPPLVRGPERRGVASGRGGGDCEQPPATSRPWARRAPRGGHGRGEG